MKKHISKLLVCCLALGAILIPTASAAEGIYEDFTYVDFFFTGNTYDVSNPCIKGARGDASVEVTKFRNETDSDVVSYGVDYYTGRRATIEQRISGEVTYLQSGLSECLEIPVKCITFGLSVPQRRGPIRTSK